MRCRCSLADYCLCCLATTAIMDVSDDKIDDKAEGLQCDPEMMVRDKRLLGV